MAKILGIAASPRKGGNSDVLLKNLLKGAAIAGAKTEQIRLIDYQFQPCIGCERCRKDGRCTGLQDGMQLLYPKIEEADGLILISPTHNYNITAWMKAFIDRLYCFYIFNDERPRSWSSRLGGQGRKSIIAAVGEQLTREDAIGLTLDAMRLPVEALGYEVINELPVTGIFDKGKVKDDSQVLDQVQKMGEKLAKEIKK